MYFARLTLITACIALAACGTSQPPPEQSNAPSDPELSPDSTDPAPKRITRLMDGSDQPEADGTSAREKTLTQAGINYHGGAVMTGGANVYYIWYGNWQGS